MPAAAMGSMSRRGEHEGMGGEGRAGKLMSDERQRRSGAAPPESPRVGSQNRQPPGLFWGMMGKKGGPHRPVPELGAELVCTIKQRTRALP